MEIEKIKLAYKRIQANKIDLKLKKVIFLDSGVL